MNWTLAISAFTFIFLAALPGRTTFLMLLLAARDRASSVFLGAVLAFAIQAAISVALGNLFAFVPPRMLQVGVGLLLIYFSIHFWRDSRRQGNEGVASIQPNSVRSVFLLVFAAEWGDVSQVAIASFSARNPDRLVVYFSAIFALWAIVGLSVVTGTYLRRAVNPSLIQKLAAIGFALSGLYLVTRGVLNSVRLSKALRSL